MSKMAFIHAADLPQGNEKWLAWRNGGVGASEIFTLAAYAEAIGFKEPSPRPVKSVPSWCPTPRQLYRRKKGVDGPVAVNANMQRGHRLEPLLRDGFNSHFGRNCEPVCVEGSGPWRVSLDGFQRGLLLEIKAPSRRWDALPEYVAHQVAYQRGVLATGGHKPRSGVIAGYQTDEGKYVVSGGDEPLSFDSFAVPKEVEFEEWLLELSLFFWKTYIQKNKEPAPVAGDVDIRKDKTFVAVAARYLAASEALKRAKDDEKAARDTLLETAGDFRATLVGGGVRMTRVVRDGAVDYRKIIADMLPGLTDDQTRQYRKPSTETVMVNVDK